MHTIINTELLDALRALPDNTYDGILCDPPYELGFMGKSWDASGVAFRPETWAELLRVCKPGAHLLAFGGTRTYHRLACAIEDAGWELRDSIMWVYGSGFPKSMDVSKALDKAAGAERKVLGVSDNWRESKRDRESFGSMEVRGENAGLITAPATDAARMWEGYGTALKPAYEPCLLARKPLEGTVAANVQKWGCGALWIDGGRVGTTGARNNGRTVDSDIYGKFGPTRRVDYGKGRWPANLLHDGSPEVTRCFPESAEQQGDVRGTEPSRTGGDGTNCYGKYSGQRPPAASRKDGGSAARFFYCAKASKAERNAGCDALPVKHLAQGNQAKAELARGNVDHSGNSGFNTVKAVRNVHPTVKPLDLCRYLATLILPPADRPQGPRKLLTPFSGSGSEMIGALQAGWDDVTGIEREAEYVQIAQVRLAHHLRPVSAGLPLFKHPEEA